MIPANKYKTAVKELATIQLQQGFEIPSEVENCDAPFYHTICVKSRDTADGMGKIHHARIIKTGFNDWQKMEAQIKAGTFKAMHGGMFNKVVVLHDPTIKEEPKEKKPKADEQQA